MPAPPTTPIPPSTLIIGKIDGEWPIQVFPNIDTAAHWRSSKTKEGIHSDKIHIWNLVVGDWTYYDYEPPQPAKLIPRKKQ